MLRNPSEIIDFLAFCDVIFSFFPPVFCRFSLFRGSSYEYCLLYVFFCIHENSSSYFPLLFFSSFVLSLQVTREDKAKQGSRKKNVSDTTLHFFQGKTKYRGEGVDVSIWAPSGVWGAHTILNPIPGINQVRPSMNRSTILFSLLTTFCTKIYINQEQGMLVKHPLIPKW